MKKTEIIRFLKYMNSYYSSKFEFPKETKANTEFMIRTWQDFLQDYPEELVCAARDKLLIEKEWPPTPGEIVKEIAEIQKSEEDKMEWEESYHKTMDLIAKHGVQYGLDNIKKELSDRSIKAAQLMGGFTYMGRKITDKNRDFAMNRYKEVYNKLKDQEEEYRRLPPSKRKQVEAIASKFKGNRRIQIKGEKVKELEG